MTSIKGIRVAHCPIQQEYCYPSCRFRYDLRCYYQSQRGRKIALFRGAYHRFPRHYRATSSMLELSANFI